MLEHTGVLFTYLIAIKDDETDRISVSGINSLQCLLKDFPLRIAELKEEAEGTNPEDILEIYCIFGAIHRQRFLWIKSGKFKILCIIIFLLIRILITRLLFCRI